MTLSKRVYPVTFFLILLLSAGFIPQALAQDSSSPSIAGNNVERSLFSAQVDLLGSDSASAAKDVQQAQAAYVATLQKPISAAVPQIAAALGASFKTAFADAQSSNDTDLSATRSAIWANLLHASSVIVVQALQKNDSATAKTWLLLREFPTPTQFSRPGADATLAMNALVAGKMSATDALSAVRDDLLDTYQAKLNEALSNADVEQKQNFTVKTVEQASLAAGYFDLLTDPILSNAFVQAHGASALKANQTAFAALVQAASSNDAKDYQTLRTQIDSVLQGFRAAPLSPAEQARSAGQLLRFVGLIPVEYGRGVANGVVMKDIEVQEALTFLQAAQVAYVDLQDNLEARDPATTAQVGTLLTTVLNQIHAVADPNDVQHTVDQINDALNKLYPPEWKSINSASDVDVIDTLLDQVSAAATQGEYSLAESARLQAYATLEFGIEQSLRGFAPDKSNNIESLFWQGTSDQPGLAVLIASQAPVDAIKAEIGTLKAALADAQTFLDNQKTAPGVVATNAGIIVLREGLEAILILASLLASLRTVEERQFRRPIMIGATVAFVAAGVTWWLANDLLMSMMALGERLEAIVSLIAIIVLLLITNWFFHKVYWTGWMANFHTQKRRLLAGTFAIAVSQSVGLAILGFTSIYREGFETVLFLQSLVLQAGINTVLQGVAIGLIGVAIIGVITFVLQFKLPYKKMLVVTGIMIGFVLLVMVGTTVQVMQSVGWMPITPITGLYLPFWVGQWLGVYATWQGIVLQAIAAIFVIGSYFWAEWLSHHRRETIVAQRGAQPSKVG